MFGLLRRKYSADLDFLDESGRVFNGLDLHLPPSVYVSPMRCMDKHTGYHYVLNSIKSRRLQDIQLRKAAQECHEFRIADHPADRRSLREGFHGTRGD